MHSYMHSIALVSVLFKTFLKETEMTPNLFDVKFEQIKADLKAVIPEHSYQMWIEPLWLMTNECTNSKMVIACPNEFSRKRTIENFLPQMQHLAGRIEIMLKTAIIVPPRPSVYLPIWRDNIRAVPAPLVRSALFGIVRRGNRRFINKEKIPSWTNVDLTFKGEQLAQRELDVFMYACKLHSTLRIPLGEPVPFKCKTFLGKIGLAKSKANRDYLNDMFWRLAGTLGVTSEETTYCNSLIDKFVHDKEKQDYWFVLDPDIFNLFGDDYVWLDWTMRKELKGDLTKWMHAYICSHKSTINKPHMIGLEKLHWLCGSVQDFPLFKFNVNKIMEYFKEKGFVDFIIKPNNVLMFYRLDK